MTNKNNRHKDGAAPSIAPGQDLRRKAESLAREQAFSSNPLKGGWIEDLSLKDPKSSGTATTKTTGCL